MTNKNVLRSADQYMADYVSRYRPLYPLFLDNSQAYALEVGKLNFKRLEAVGDIRSKHYTPKDSHIHQVGAIEKSKTFKQYPLASQFTQSNFQDSKQNEDVVRQILDEHQKQFDELFLLGDGTSSSNVFNNGLFWSGDANWVEEGSATIDGDSVDPLIDFHAKIMASAEEADLIAGRKVIVLYGEDIIALYNAVYQANAMPFKGVLKSNLENNFSVAKMPAAITPANANGWIVANLDQTKLHYSMLPRLLDQGVNAEKMHSWHNFAMGSCMLDVLASGAVIKQPATIDLGV